MTRSVMPDGCYRASSLILSLPTFPPLDYGKMDSRLKLAGMTGRETAGMTEGLTVRQLAKKPSLDLEEIIACVVCV